MLDYALIKFVEYKLRKAYIFLIVFIFYLIKLFQAA